MKQASKISVSKSHENPNFSKIRDQIMKKQPISILSIFGDPKPKQYKPLTPQYNQKKQTIKITNQRPISQSAIKEPLASPNNRISERQTQQKLEKSQDLRKSTKNNNQDIKEMTFGKGLAIEAEKQDFNRTFNKFNNGILLQSMKLSKEQIEENNEYKNRDMKEQDDEDEEIDDSYGLRQKQQTVEKKQTSQPKQVEQPKQLLSPKQTISPKQILQPKQNIDYNRSPSQQLNMSVKPIHKQQKYSYQPIALQSKNSYQQMNNPKQQSTIKRPNSTKPINSPILQVQKKSVITPNSTLKRTAQFKKF